MDEDRAQRQLAVLRSYAETDIPINAREWRAAADTITALRSRVEALMEERSSMIQTHRENLDRQDRQIAKLTAERDRLGDRSYTLAVAIMGGEDAPGHADSVPAEVLAEQIRKERRERDAWTDAAVRAAVDAERDRLLSAQGWQDIATAPKDGTTVILCDNRVADGYIAVASRKLMHGESLWVHAEGTVGYPDGFFTHWMLPPEPPAFDGDPT